MVSFLVSPSVSASRAWIGILPALLLPFADLQLCRVSRRARSSTQGLRGVLDVMNVPFFLAYKCSSSVDHFPRTFLLLGVSCKNWTSPVSPLPHAHDHQHTALGRHTTVPTCPIPLVEMKRERDLFPFWLYKATMEMMGSVLVTLLSLSTRE